MSEKPGKQSLRSECRCLVRTEVEIQIHRSEDKADPDGIGQVALWVSCALCKGRVEEVRAEGYVRTWVAYAGRAQKVAPYDL